MAIKTSIICARHGRVTSFETITASDLAAIPEALRGGLAKEVRDALAASSEVRICSVPSDPKTEGSPPCGRVAMVECAGCDHPEHPGRKCSSMMPNDELGHTVWCGCDLTPAAEG